MLFIRVYYIEFPIRILGFPSETRALHVGACTSEPVGLWTRWLHACRTDARMHANTSSKKMLFLEKNSSFDEKAIFQKSVYLVFGG